MELDYVQIGRRVKIARIRRGWTQEKLAEAAGISPTHMSNIETGTTRVSLTTLVRLANALRTTPDGLLCDDIAEARPQITAECAQIFADCTPYELRLLRDIASAAKEAIRRNHP